MMNIDDLFQSSILLPSLDFTAGKVDEEGEAIKKIRNEVFGEEIKGSNKQSGLLDELVSVTSLSVPGGSYFYLDHVYREDIFLKPNKTKKTKWQQIIQLLKEVVISANTNITTFTKNILTKVKVKKGG
jgi:hypothetical protein